MAETKENTTTRAFASRAKNHQKCRIIERLKMKIWLKTEKNDKTIEKNGKFSMVGSIKM